MRSERNATCPVPGTRDKLMDESHCGNHRPPPHSKWQVSWMFLESLGLASTRACRKGELAAPLPFLSEPVLDPWGRGHRHPGGCLTASCRWISPDQLGGCFLEVHHLFHVPVSCWIYLACDFAHLSLSYCLFIPLRVSLSSLALWAKCQLLSVALCERLQERVLTDPSLEGQEQFEGWPHMKFNPVRPRGHRGHS